MRNGIPDVDDRGEEAELSMFTVYYSEVFFIPNVRCMHVIAEAVEKKKVFGTTSVYFNILSIPFSGLRKLK